MALFVCYSNCMSNLLIGYPSLSAADYDWIQDIRKKNDPKYYNVVRPHITLVFGTDKLTVIQLHDHASSVLAEVAAISLIFDKAIVVEDDSKTFYHTFIVPSKGYDEIITIHDLLYSGELSSELREDIPFIPHIGIGTCDKQKPMQSLVKRLNTEKFYIAGTLDKVSIVQYDGAKVTDITTTALS